MGTHFPLNTSVWNSTGSQPIFLGLLHFVPPSSDKVGPHPLDLTQRSSGTKEPSQLHALSLSTHPALRLHQHALGLPKIWPSNKGHGLVKLLSGCHWNASEHIIGLRKQLWRDRGRREGERAGRTEWEVCLCVIGYLPYFPSWPNHIKNKTDVFSSELLQILHSNSCMKTLLLILIWSSIITFQSFWKGGGGGGWNLLQRADSI